VLGEEGLALMEHNADTILEEIGIDFRDDPEALEIWKAAGADVKGERVHFARGMCRSLVQRTAPREFTQHARNPARNVVIGGKNTVFAPAYGSPFVRSLDEGRRYARIEDFRNFVKLAYMAHSLHHSGGTICEPVDLPVNKRHLDMVYSHLKYSDKAFMGSVTAPERAADSVALANIVFGDELTDPLTGRPKTTIINLINVNSPMTYDATMLGAAKVYARANQALIITPFILAGAMSPVTVAGTVAQTLAEALAGLAFVQLVNPGAPVVLGSFASSISMQSGAPTFGTPEPALVLYSMAALGLEDPGCAGCLRVGEHPGADLPRRRQFRPAHGRVARGWPGHGLRKVRHGRGPGGHDAYTARGRGLVGERPSARCHARGRSRQAFLGLRPHPGQFRECVLPLAARG
jgi:trimethylamine--corrinoid protein Co-methyltransferase